MWARNLSPICVSQNCPWASFMFPSLLPHTTRSTIETAPKLVNFCACKSYFKNVVYSGATSLCGHILNYKNHQTPRHTACLSLKTHVVPTWVLKTVPNSSHKGSVQANTSKEPQISMCTLQESTRSTPIKVWYRLNEVKCAKYFTRASN